MIYQIPVLESLLNDKNSKAMYIFPTKALAQDQKRALEDIMQGIPQLEDVMVRLFAFLISAVNSFFIRFLLLTEILQPINALS